MTTTEITQFVKRSAGSFRQHQWAVGADKYMGIVDHRQQVGIYRTGLTWTAWGAQRKLARVVAETEALLASKDNLYGRILFNVNGEMNLNHQGYPAYI